jgi:DTW domain-containing protein YfiP
VASGASLARATHRMVHPREVAHAAAHFAANRERMATTRCMACWVTRAHCMCARLRRLRVTTELVDVLVAVHYKEYGKATNTAKLLPHLLSAAGDGATGELGAAGHTVAAAGSCSLCVYPVEPLQEQLGAAGPTLLLWPGEDSVPAAELRPWVAAQGQRVTLLVIDGS